MSIKLTSWNVNGIRAINKKDGFWQWFENNDADIVNFQEIRAQLDEIPKNLYRIKGYDSFFTCAERRGYSSVASYTKLRPINVFHSMGVPKLDVEGRILRMDFNDFILLNVYFPNSGPKGEKLDKKIEFCNQLTNYIVDLKDNGNNIVLAGDVNIAHKPIDVARPKQDEGKSGFLLAERDWLSEFLDLGFIDTFRLFNKGSDNYTWWSYRYHARDKNIGWRLDYFFVNKELKNKVISAGIESDVRGSDHCPISLELDL